MGAWQTGDDAPGASSAGPGVLSSTAQAETEPMSFSHRLFVAAMDSLGFGLGVA